MDVKHLAVVFVIIAASSGCATPAGGRWPQEGVVSPGDAPRPATVAPADKLVLSAAPERTRYVEGEPVYLAITVRNAGERPERVFKSLYPEDGAIDILVTTPEGRKREFVPLGETDQDETVFASLAPGATIGNIVPVFFGGRGWTFDKPGRYTLVAIYRVPDGKGTVRQSVSPPVAIEIAPSAEGSSLVGDGGPVSIETGKFLTWQAGDHLDKGRARLTEVIERSPDSVLASYAHFALGRSWSDSFMDYRRRQVRPPNCDLAMRHLSKVRSEQVTDYVRVQAGIAAARCMARDRKTDAARRFIGATREIMRDRPEYRSLAVRLGEIERGKR